ncbi:MAG: HNH endonuclease [Beijerinckiaceae bacterium]|nr:HNH endonuclease [Beijerinckiaceae bacterium]
MTRPTARERGYTTAWDKARAGHLRSHPHCVMCAKTGRTTPATHVDHVKPHRGDQAAFWDRANWQSLCASHHSSAKQRDDNAGRSVAVDADGWPIDPAPATSRR